ncbi:MAG: hypothetical protein NZ912_01835 [Ignisphaera sp.]|nr:hypothetical protein [Ignisphaera sp.]
MATGSIQPQDPVSEIPGGWSREVDILLVFEGGSLAVPLINANPYSAKMFSAIQLSYEWIICSW